MADKYVIQRRTASGLENVAELPALENGKIDLSWLPVVGAMGSAIIERGSNANGEYIRWADGTQVCWKIFRSAEDSSIAPVDITISKGNMFVSPGRTWTFPATFYGYSCVLFSGFYAQGIDATCVFGKSYANGGSLATYFIISPISQTATIDVYYSLMAIGRWK